MELKTVAEYFPHDSLKVGTEECKCINIDGQNIRHLIINDDKKNLEAKMSFSLRVNASFIQYTTGPYDGYNLTNVYSKINSISLENRRADPYDIYNTVYDVSIENFELVTIILAAPATFTELGVQKTNATGGASVDRWPCYIGGKITLSIKTPAGETFTQTRSFDNELVGYTIYSYGETVNNIDADLHLVFYHTFE